MKEREIIVTDDYKFNKKPYQGGRYIGVGNPKALWKEVSYTGAVYHKLETYALYDYVKGECDREYGFYYEPKETE